MYFSMDWSLDVGDVDSRAAIAAHYFDFFKEGADYYCKTDSRNRGKQNWRPWILNWLTWGGLDNIYKKTLPLSSESKNWVFVNVAITNFQFQIDAELSVSCKQQQG